MKKKIFLFGAVLFWLLPLCLLNSATARASILQFDVADRVLGSWGRTMGLQLREVNNSVSYNYFSFLGATFTVDATPGGTGRGVIEGMMEHTFEWNWRTNVFTDTVNRDLWSFRIDIDNVRMLNNIDILSQPVPFDDMFQEIITGGTLVWDTATLTMTTAVLNPEFIGLRFWRGKPNTNGDVSHWDYNKWGAGGSAAFPNYWGTSIWWQYPNGTFAGDAHFTIGNQPSAISPEIPEPSTFLLLGLGFLGFFLKRKYKRVLENF